MSSTLKIWLKGLLSAVIGGFATGITTYFTDSNNVMDKKRIFIVALSGALVTVIAYIKQSPIPLKELVKVITNNKENQNAATTN